MTIDDLAGMTRDEFRTLRQEMATKDDLKQFATKDDLRHFATKTDLEEFKDQIIGEVRKENTKVIHSNDRVATKLDIIIKDLAAHDSLHRRITDELHDHDRRIKKLEETKTA